MVTITDEEFEQLSRYIKQNYGINLKEEKKYLIIGRLQNVLAEKGFSTFAEYIGYIYSDRSGEAINTLISRITTNHTFFLREPEHFEFFKCRVLPELEVRESKTRDLRIWSAGCSTGEEAYTLAMIMYDYFGIKKKDWDARILATDISPYVIENAKIGRYSQEQIKNIPESWVCRYFTRLENGDFQINEFIKDEVIFRKFNLMNPKFPFKKRFHTIFCRNVMIYFDTETKNNLVERFYDALEPGGYLFIGHAEALDRTRTRFKYVSPSIYRKDLE